MENYKPNSHVSKETQNTEVIPEKKVEKVVSHEVRVKKKTGLEKFAGILIQEDVQNVKSYILMDVLIPALKKAISDIVSNGVDMMLYGESRGRSSGANAGSRVSYRNYYDNRRDTRPTSSTRSRNGYDFEPPVFENRGEAEGVLDSMDDLIERYGAVSIADLYDLCGIQTTNHTTGNYGWTDLRSASVAHVVDGFIIRLPRALPIN